MKLEGSLDAFGLPDIFQLLSFTKKSGGLHLRGGAGEGVVYFTAGSVSGASADEGRQALARRLVGSSAVDDDALAAAVERARAEGVGVGKALLESDQVSSDVLQEAATEQAVDAVFDLLRWSEGEFAFSIDEPNPDDVGVALPTDRVVAEAEARRTTWTTVAQVVPSPDLVPRLPVLLPADPEVTRDEWALLALVDGRRRVRDLVELTGAGEFAVASALAALVERGLVELAVGTEDHVSRVRRRFGLLGPLESEPSDAHSESPTAPTQAADTDRTDAEPDDEPHDEPGSRPEAEAADEADDEPADEPDEPDEPDDEPDDERDSEPNDGPIDEPDSAPTTSGGPILVSTTPGAPAPSPMTGPQAPLSATVSAPVSAAVTSTVLPSTAATPVVGTAAAVADPAASSLLDRDPSINRSLLLRLIAGVRGL